jgi:hypothetical protein
MLGLSLESGPKPGELFVVQVSQFFESQKYGCDLFRSPFSEKLPAQFFAGVGSSGEKTYCLIEK